MNIDEAGNLSATELKLKGNEFFGSSQAVQAVKWYTLAIEKLESKPKDDEERLAQLHLCYSNRCLANREKGDYEQSLKDAESALALKPDFHKSAVQQSWLSPSPWQT
jgi:hypothetical protein